MAVTALLLISVIMLYDTYREMEKHEQDLLQGQMDKAALFSDRIAHGIMFLMLKNRWQDLQQMIEDMVKGSDELKEVRIFSPDTGTIAASSHPEEIGSRIYKDDLDRFAGQDEQRPFIVEKHGVRYASNLTAINNQAPCHKCHGKEEKVLGVLDVELSIETVYETLKETRRDHFKNAVIGSLLILATFIFVIKIWIDRPINKIKKGLKKVEAGDLTVKIRDMQNDELGDLAKSFNLMVESLYAAGQEIEYFHDEQIKRAAKLASLGEMASGIAHEIKNPLAGISSAVQILVAGLGDEDPKKKIMNEVLNQVNRLDRAVKDLLAYARPAPPKMAYDNINPVIEKALFFIQQLAVKGNTKIEIHIDRKLPKLMFDADQIQQVFINISINAIQAMKDGGDLKILSELISSGSPEMIPDILDERKEWIKISFEDTGPGISDEDMSKIFNPFFTKKGKGTGLGLSISQRIIEEHGGKIIVSNREKKGSDFSIFLPVTDDPGNLNTG